MTPRGCAPGTEAGRGVWRLVIGLGVVLALATPAWTQTIPPHPTALEFPPLDYTPPERERHRVVLDNGVAAYMVEDHDLPLVTVAVLIRAGAFLEPPEKAGLADAVGDVMRTGGTEELTAEEFDERVDFLAADVSSGIGLTTGSASVNFLAKDAAEALDLFFAMLRRPRFQENRLELFKRQRLQQMARRNDSPGGIEAREWLRLLRGTDHFSTRFSTQATIEAITRDDLLEFHRRYVHPGNFVLAVSGDFQVEDMKERLERLMDGWAPGATVPPVPKPSHVPAPGLYLVDKAEVNQGRVSIGHLGIERGHPDEIAIDLMNEILGGSGFTSRITNRVRTEEGLAYSAGSVFNAGVYYPGEFRVALQSKSASVARAIQIVLEEIERIRDQGVSAEELATVKSYAIEVFPRIFASAESTARTFASDELTGRPADYWDTYRDRVRAVTAEDVRRVAREYLDPDGLVILAVGSAEELLRGDPDHPEYTLEQLADGDTIVRIPLPDPMTLQYPPDR